MALVVWYWWGRSEKDGISDFQVLFLLFSPHSPVSAIYWPAFKPCGPLLIKYWHNSVTNITPVYWSTLLLGGVFAGVMRKRSVRRKNDLRRVFRLSKRWTLGGSQRSTNSRREFIVAGASDLKSAKRSPEDIRPHCLKINHGIAFFCGLRAFNWNLAPRKRLQWTSILSLRLCWLFHDTALSAILQE